MVPIARVILAIALKLVIIARFSEGLSILQIWSHLLKKSLIGNLIFCAVSEYGENRKSTAQKQIFF